MTYREPSAFGRYLRSKRVAAFLSLRDVADATGISFVFLGEVERGVRPVVKRERWKALEQAIPGFSADEAERLMSKERPVELPLENAPPKYRNLGLLLARRIDRQDLAPRELDELIRILAGGDDEDG